MSDFHRVLNELSKHIDSDTLNGLKYMCQDLFKPAKLEKITTSLMLLTELERCDKIHDGDVQFLIHLLQSEGKSPLVEKLLPLNYSANETVQETLSFCTEHHSQQQPVHNSQGNCYLSLNVKFYYCSLHIATT